MPRKNGASRDGAGFGRLRLPEIHAAAGACARVRLLAPFFVGRPHSADIVGVLVRAIRAETSETLMAKDHAAEPRYSSGSSSKVLRQF